MIQGPICRYELSNDNSEYIPFVVEVNDENLGLGVVRVKDGVHLDCSSPQYFLNLVAVRCGDFAKSEMYENEKISLDLYL